MDYSKGFTSHLFYIYSSLPSKMCLMTLLLEPFMVRKNPELWQCKCPLHALDNFD